MSWNHRVIRQTDPNGTEYLGIHEVYYNRDGTPRMYTENAVGVTGATLDELRLTLGHMRISIASPILTPADFVDKDKSDEIPVSEEDIAKFLQRGQT